MKLARTIALAVEGRLYPSVILHGGSEATRLASAITFARALLCERPAGERPCGECRHCRRITLPELSGEAAETFHPDFLWLVRDLKTSISAEATREMLRSAQLSPYEARGQVFVIAEAASLSSEASDALLKAIEEPGLKSPRNFFLLCPSRLDLSPTLRSRSLAIYLGAAAAMPQAALEAVASGFRASVERFVAGGGGLWLLDAAARLDPVGKRSKTELEALRKRRAAAAAPDGEQVDELDGFEDPRAQRPWLFAAAAVRLAAVGFGDGPPPEPALRRRMLALAEELLNSSPLRLRGIPADRILEGLVCRHFTG
ncbi:MAG: hypothetical protein KBF21_02755 [Thermoanaerobaculia bacterium]|nr:hypothetical protein [Thermoanaerobaculia bacterium]MBP9823122.1 hypothetical protein [Thermoanaerobaculia bacterium]